MCCKLAEITANWWIEQMKHKCCVLFPSKVIRSNTGFVVVNDFLEEDLCRFQKILIDQICSCLKNEHCSNLYCYYYPCKELLELAKQANISTAYFPVKAQSIVNEKSIKVSTNTEDFYTLPFSTNNL